MYTYALHQWVIASTIIYLFSHRVLALWTVLCSIYKEFCVHIQKNFVWTYSTKNFLVLERGKKCICTHNGIHSLFCGSLPAFPLSLLSMVRKKLLKSKSWATFVKKDLMVFTMSANVIFSIRSVFQHDSISNSWLYTTRRHSKVLASEQVAN